MKRVFVLGGTGQIGRAVAARFGEAGWEVAVGARLGPIQVDRSVPGGLERALGDGADVLVDVIAFTVAEGEQLNALAGLLGSLVVISSASVYRDDAGHTLDEAHSLETFPRLPVPIPETHPTVAPSLANYSTQKVALEQTVLEGPLPTTIVRPCAIHGPGSRLPRELFFVRRVCDGRRQVLLVDEGKSRFHTTSVVNLAELILLAAEQPSDRILNCGDPEPPTVSEIGLAIEQALDAELEQILVPYNGYERSEVSNPWAVPFPIVVDMTAADRELDYRPVTDYQGAVGATCAWLAHEVTKRDWSSTYLGMFFDYAAEDSAIAEARTGERG